MQSRHRTISPPPGSRTRELLDGNRVFDRHQDTRADQNLTGGLASSQSLGATLDTVPMAPSRGDPNTINSGTLGLSDALLRDILVGMVGHQQRSDDADGSAESDVTGNNVARCGYGPSPSQQRRGNESSCAFRPCEVPDVGRLEKILPESTCRWKPAGVGKTFPDPLRGGSVTAPLLWTAPCGSRVRSVFTSQQCF
jgi:hypothetical protein